MMRHETVLRVALRLLQPFWPVALCATIVGALGGLATAGLLATINRGLHAPDGISGGLLLQFAGLCALSLSGSAVAGIGNSIVGQRLIAALRKDISARILDAPIEIIERYRSHRLLAILTSDVDTVSAFTFNFSAYAIAFAITIGGFAYLFLLSPLVFLLAAAGVALGVGLGIYAKRSWMRDYERVRDAQDMLQKQYRAITEGAKELRLNRTRRAQVHGELLSGAADRIATLKIGAMRRFWAADAIGAAIFFLVIGILLMIQPRLEAGPAAVSGAVLVLLYIKGPVDQIISCLPVFAQAQVAFRRIAALTADFQDTEPAIPVEGSAVSTTIGAIELRDAQYAFKSADGSAAFVLGPIDLTVHRGETLFIVGENGSGKTTLIKLLLGLYVPTSGKLLLDGKVLPPDSLDNYRQHFSAVFSDYFLFDALLTPGADAAEHARSYLERLEIAHKVGVENGSFTTTELSTGQRKRLALVHAYLEQRPVMMFDEWAADQDPTFRRVFYSELLPDLKRQGKTLIVVSHDDRFFDAADRIIRLEAGKIVEDRQIVTGLAVSGVS